VTALAAAHAAPTLAMAGLIWFVQVVHYPLFAAVGPGAFAAYSRQHQALTTLVVGPLMFAEAATALLLIRGAPGDWRVWAGLGLLVIIWFSTAFLQVPLHGKLAQGLDPATIDRLIQTNWIRTAAWTGRAVLAISLCWPRPG
jgi:hypothetical protein